jgi:hypothetical protein
MQGYFESTGSQISLLGGSSGATVHWFTTGSDPSETCYKPFAFGADGGVGVADGPGGDTAQLWRAHKQKRQGARAELLKLEAELVRRVGDAGGCATPEMFLDAVQQERALIQRFS